eukprot:3223038-Amphidinium_carterae.1
MKNCLNTAVAEQVALLWAVMWRQKMRSQEPYFIISRASGHELLHAMSCDIVIECPSTGHAVWMSMWKVTRSPRSLSSALWLVVGKQIVIQRKRRD